MGMTIGSRFPLPPAMTPGAGSVDGKAGAEGAAGAVPAPANDAELSAAIVSVVETRGRGNEPDEAAMFKLISDLLDSYFETLSDIAKNMGVSEAEREAAERRREEIEKKRRQLADLKVEDWQKFLAFLDGLVDQEDRELLEKRMAEERMV